MNLLFIQYPTCTTCRKAAKWLKDNNIEVVNRHIVEQQPTIAELSLWYSKSGLPINKFFNTSGKVYKENNIKELVKTESDEKLIELLSTNGMLVKRPILVADDFVLVGFNQEQWSKTLMGK